MRDNADLSLLDYWRYMPTEEQWTSRSPDDPRRIQHGHYWTRMFYGFVLGIWGSRWEQLVKQNKMEAQENAR